MMEKIFTIFVVGPTASGKTGLGVEIAKKYNGEVVSADSMQIYRDMCIATAKPVENEMQGILHHLIDFVNPDEDYSVAKYREDAFRVIEDIHSRGKTPVVVGGTGLYVDTLINNIEFLDFELDKEMRDSLFQRAENEGIETLYEELKKIDPQSAGKIHFNNRKKIIHALEIFYGTGKTLTEQNEQSQQKGKKLDSLIIGLDSADRQFLYDRINRRVDIMLESGLCEEAEMFYKNYGYGTANQAIGYKELLPYLKGEETLEQSVERLKMMTRRYAKRQLTWFRRYEDINWVYIDDKESAPADQAFRIIEQR